MNIEKQFIKPQEQKKELNDNNIEKSKGFTHKIFEAGAFGGKKLKTALRVLTLSMVLSTLVSDMAYAKNESQEQPQQYEQTQEYKDGQKYGKFWTESFEKEDKRQVESALKYQQYRFWQEFFNNKNIDYKFIIVPNVQLNIHDKQIISQMYQTKRLNIPQFFSIISRYDNNFVNRFAMTRNMITQKIDGYGNHLTEKQLNIARNNYIQSIYYILGEICN